MKWPAVKKLSEINTGDCDEEFKRGSTTGAGDV